MPNPAPEYYQFEEVNQPVLKLFRDAKQQGDPSETVLDLGCGRAGLGGELQRLGYSVTGIEASDVAIAVARERIAELVELDLLRYERSSEIFAGRQFDWLLASDVLEHLPCPLEALLFYCRLLKPNGRLVVSLPNIALWTVRLGLLLGQFNYGYSGVMDRTHLRFFTVRTARQLLKEAGFKILSTTYDPGIVRVMLPVVKRVMSGSGSDNPGAILHSKSYRLYLDYIYPTESLACRLVPRLLSFRIVMLAIPASSAP
jgi:2-polyprenyl-3-methyl-5-hydroxy-6-metoxy-1,4-benzoquinol methylase